MSNQFASGLKTSGGSFPVIKPIGKELIKLSKHVKKTTPAGSLGLSIIHSIGHNLKDGKPHRKLMGKKALTHLKKFLKNKPHLVKSVADHHIIKFIKKHENTPVHASDLFGKQWKSKSKKIIFLLDKLHQHQKGGNIFSDIGKWTKKAVHNVGRVTEKAAKESLHQTKRFLNGETKFKPSTLLSYLSGAVSTVGAASAFIPGVDLISVPTAAAISAGLAGVSTIAKTSGRGKVKKLPNYIDWHIKNNPDEIKKIFNYLDSHQIGGLDPNTVAQSSSWLSKNGMNVLKALAMTPALIASAKSVYNLFKKKKKKSEPQEVKSQEVEPQEVELPTINQNQGWLGSGGSLYTSGIIKKKYPRSRISTDILGSGSVGSRAQVWHGKALMTQKGVTKDMLIKNKNGRLVLKSRSIAGQKAYKKRKNKTLPFKLK